MDVDAAVQTNAIGQALAAADALGKNSRNNFQDITDGLRELDMDNYDEEDASIELFSSGLGDTFYPSNDMDPYLKDKDDDDGEEIEDMTIKLSDAGIVCARNEDDVSHLELWILEESEDGDSNMYVHHDIILPAFPLCTSWLDCNLKSGDKGNFIAVGSMEPAIEIWDLDLVDEVQPFMVLGGISKKKKKSKKTSVKYKKDSHQDSVLGLAWNKEIRNVLASASADKSVKVWDVVTGKCPLTMEHHTEKVQAVAWNRNLPEVLLSGSFDHSVVMMDMRAPSQAGTKWEVAADVESLEWDPHNEHSFVVSLEDGTVQGFDIRAAASNSSSLSNQVSHFMHMIKLFVRSPIIHQQLTPLSILRKKGKNFHGNLLKRPPFFLQLLATGSTDKMVKLWDISNNQPSCVASKDPKAGAVFSVSFSEDNPFLLAIGGSKGRLEVWDTLSDPGVWRFGSSSNRRTDPMTAS